MFNISEPVALLAGVSGVLVSLILSYLPVVSDWYYSPALDKYRGLIAVGFTAVVAALIYGASCLELFGLDYCSVEGAKALLEAIVIAIGTNQLTYLASPVSPAKVEREQ